jgi:hypothetical protein
MLSLKFDKAITALIVTDPCNDLTNTTISSSRLYLGNQVSVFRRQERLHPGCRERLSRRRLSSPAELGRAGVSRTYPLQQGWEKRAQQQPLFPL